MTCMYCSRCQTEKLADQFSPKAKRRGWCRACCNAYRKDWIKAHPEYRRKRDLEKYARAQRAIHGPDWKPKPFLGGTLASLTPEEKHRRRLDQFKRCQQKRRAEGKTIALDAAKRQNRRARERAAGGRVKVADIKALWNKQGHICALCHNFMIDPSVDHIIPLSKGGTNKPDNIQLACRKCNSSKGAKIIDKPKVSQ